MSDISLQIGDLIHGGWKDARCRFSLRSIANSFSITLTDKWAENQTPRIIKKGESCKLFIDDELVLTGYVDDVFPEYDDEDYIVQITGRSKAGDLVDSTHVGRQFRGRDLKQLADELCKPFGITVLVDQGVDIGPKFKQIEIDTGESIFEFLEQAARIRALRLVSNVEGDIVITQASKKRLNTPLVLGENILKASGDFSDQERFSEVTVIGSQNGDDDGWGEVVSHIEATHKDTTVKRYRPLVINADGNMDRGDAKRRCQWEVNTRFGESKGIVYTVKGWRHDAGLWQPNVLDQVKDHRMVIDTDMLIVDVELAIDDDEGEVAQLRVMPPEAFELIDLPEPTIEEVDNGWG